MKAIKDGDEIMIEDGYLQKETIKKICGRRYDAIEKVWLVPCNESNVRLLQLLGTVLDEELTEFVKSNCDNTASDEKPIYRMPIKAEPYKHQIRAFNFAMKIFGLAEEVILKMSQKSRGVAYLMDMGTGKTITTIAVAGALFLEGKTKKMLVVCSAVNYQRVGKRVSKVCGL